jgi:hypothetical protein
MRHVTIYQSVADLQRGDFAEHAVASFVVGSRGIEHVEYGDEQIPRDIALLDLEEGQPTRVTLESDPLRWAELLPTAYRSGDYYVAVASGAEGRPEPDLVTAENQPAVALEAEPAPAIAHAYASSDPDAETIPAGGALHVLPTA